MSVMDIIDFDVEAFFERYDGFYDVLGVLGALGSIFLLLLFIELIYDSVKERGRGVGDSLANLSFLVVEYFLEATVYSLVFIGMLIFCERFAVYQIPINGWSWVACLVMADFTYYWMHRSEHTVRILWTYHSVHHSSTDYNLTTAARLFWFLDVTLWIFYVPMVLIGFDTAQILTCVLTIFTYMTWIHTRKIGKMNWLEPIMNTPSFHRVHHGRNPIYIDKNYAGVFTIWDRMFRTYQPETEKVDFGITKPINTTNPLKIGLIPFTRLFSDIWNARSWKHRGLYLVKGPGWRPDEPAP